MAETKKRGRPKKVIEEPSIVNEKTQQIRMSEEDKVTVQQVAEKWSHVFQKYASQGFDNIAASWQNSWAQLNNPFLQNFRIKQINAASAKMDQEDLQKALQNPPSAEDPLQRISMWLYYTNYVYNLLIKLNRDTPSYKYYALPQYVDKADMSTEAFKRESKLVDKILKSFKPNLTLKTVATQVNLEGKASYLPRVSYTKDNVDFFVMQKLNPDMVKLTGFGSKQQFIASFNMAIFLQPAYDVSQYPEFIRQTWEDMLTLGIIKEDKKGNKILNPTVKLPQNHSLEWNGKYYIYWVQLPQDLCYTFYVDGAHPNMFPDTIGLFNDLSELDDYRWLQANLLSKGVNSVLTAEVPLVKDPKPGQDSTAVSTDVVMGFTDMFQSLVSSNILPFFAPFD